MPLANGPETDNNAFKPGFKPRLVGVLYDGRVKKSRRFNRVFVRKKRSQKQLAPVRKLFGVYLQGLYKAPYAVTMPVKYFGNVTVPVGKFLQQRRYDGEHLFFAQFHYFFYNVKGSLFTVKEKTGNHSFGIRINS